MRLSLHGIGPQPPFPAPTHRASEFALEPGLCPSTGAEGVGGEAETHSLFLSPQFLSQRELRWDEVEGGHLWGPPVRLPLLQRPRELNSDDLTGVQSFPRRQRAEQRALECALLTAAGSEPGQGSQAVGVAGSAQTLSPQVH